MVSHIVVLLQSTFGHQSQRAGNHFAQHCWHWNLVMPIFVCWTLMGRAQWTTFYNNQQQQHGNPQWHRNMMCCHSWKNKEQRSHCIWWKQKKSRHMTLNHHCYKHDWPCIQDKCKEPVTTMPITIEANNHTPSYNPNSNGVPHMLSVFLIAIANNGIGAVISPSINSISLLH